MHFNRYFERDTGIPCANQHGYNNNAKKMNTNAVDSPAVVTGSTIKKALRERA